MTPIEKRPPRIKASVLLLYVWLTLRVVFGAKALLFLVGVAIYFPIFCVVTVRTGATLTLQQVLFGLVWMPTTLFAVFFSMEMISRERDAGLLETLFTVSASSSRLWIFKFMTIIFCVALLALALITATYWYAADIPILLTLIYILPPVIFFAGLTTMFSVMLKSGTAAGICIAAVLGFVLILSEGLSTTIVFPYLNPFDKPNNVESFIWTRTVLYNKIAYVLLGGICFWRALRWLDRRERLLS